MLCALADAPAAARHRDHNSENRKRSVIAYARAGSGRANVQMGWERIPFELVAAAGGGGGGSEPVGALISSAPPPARRKAEAALSAAALLCSDMSQKRGRRKGEPGGRTMQARITCRRWRDALRAR